MVIETLPKSAFDFPDTALACRDAATS